MERCLHRGEIVGHTRCSFCQGRVHLAVYNCSKLGQCTIATKVHNASCCSGCEHYLPTPKLEEPIKSLIRREGDASPTFSTPSVTSLVNPPFASDPIPSVDPAIPLVTSAKVSVEPVTPQLISAPPSTTEHVRPSKIRWTYGITTVPERMSNLLPATVMSLRLAGFDRPRLFVDGCPTHRAQRYEEEFRLEVVARNPKVRTAGNWVLSMMELFILNPACDRYALFQDDLVACKNLRSYLDKRCSTFPTNSYLNLICQMENEELEKKGEIGFQEGASWVPQRKGMPHVKDQAGRGAVALVFDREGLCTLLSQPDFVRRHMDANRGWRAIDGGIVTAMNKAGYRELVHYPSLVQHTGDISSMGHHPHPRAKSFVGESFNALELLEK